MDTVSNFMENAIGLKMVIDCDTSIYTRTMDTAQTLWKMQLVFKWL